MKVPTLLGYTYFELSVTAQKLRGSRVMTFKGVKLCAPRKLYNGFIFRDEQSWAAQKTV